MSFKGNPGKTSGICRACSSLRDSEGGCKCAVDVESLMQEPPGGKFTAVDAVHVNALRGKKLQATRPQDPESGNEGGPIKLGAGVIRTNQRPRDIASKAAPTMTNSSLRKAQRKAKWKSS